MSPHSKFVGRAGPIVSLLLCTGLISGCSVRQIAINRLGDALASSGTAFASDNDPELIREAVPFSLKLIESVLEQAPRHQGLLLAAASGFTQYAYAFVQQDSDYLRDRDLERSRHLLVRAKKLYLRARDYGLRGLAVKHADFRPRLETDPVGLLAKLSKADVPLLYWTSAAWLGAIGTDKTDSYLLSDLPLVEALLLRAAALDEAFERGAIPTLLITLETIRAGEPGDPFERARRRYQRALVLSQGTLAGPHVALAEAVCLPQENREEFLEVLNKALAIDPDAAPEVRLANLLSQRRARWLLSRIDELFLPPLEETRP